MELARKCVTFVKVVCGKWKLLRARGVWYCGRSQIWTYSIGNTSAFMFSGKAQIFCVYVYSELDIGLLMVLKDCQNIWRLFLQT
jgi:hypothetical protein